MKKICLIIWGLFLVVFSSFASGKTLTFCGVNQYGDDWVGGNQVLVSVYVAEKELTNFPFPYNMGYPNEEYGCKDVSVSPEANQKVYVNIKYTDFTKRLEINYDQKNSLREIVLLNYTLNSVGTSIADFSLHLKAPKPY
ncbi:MAG: hypothetical protein K0R94_1248 [Burkholderiales bacterium]|jgi:hypothetical protein|nr:hypothetical protein [Burkholderiales bacterium]